MSANQNNATEQVAIKPLDIRILRIRIKGDAPLVIQRFSQKSKLAIQAAQEAGSTARKNKAHAARNFAADFVDAQYFDGAEGWSGMAASSFRNACIRASSVAGFKMTLAKLSIFVEPDGFDKLDGTPLVRIQGSDPEPLLLHTRNKTGVVDLRNRPMWRRWHIDLALRYDAGQFTATDVVNLINRAGQQVGVGEGRPFSKDSAGIGYGIFSVDPDQGATEQGKGGS